MIGKERLEQSSSALTVVALVLALALLAAAASVDAPFRSLLRGGATDPDRLMLDLLPVALLGAGLAVSWALIVHVRTREQRGALPFRTLLARALPPAAAGVVVVCLLLLAHFEFVPPPDRTTEIPVETESRPFILWSMSGWFEGLAFASEGTGGPDRGAETSTLGGGRLSFFQIMLGLAAVLLAGAIFWYRRRGGQAGIEDEPEEEDQEAVRERARDALADTIRAMLADPNPNTAIRGAYARLLQGLEERGRGRLEHEGPVEHLHRVLTTLRVRPAPLRELIELFELARFSPRVLTVLHRDRALLALRAVAADLDPAPRSRP
jgi:hypothetical protein